MKKLSILVLFFTFCVSSLFAQAPARFSYQAVVRNDSNRLVQNRPVGVQASILSDAGEILYRERHVEETNENGLLTVEIGAGEVQEGSFSDIQWGTESVFLRTEIDPTGGWNYVLSITQRLVSVPYALYAAEAGNGFSGDYNDLTNKPDIPTVPTNVSAFNNDAGYITLSQVPPQVNADWNATSGTAQILNKPTIPTVPTNVSAFSNDAGYVTSSQIPSQVNADWNATTGAAQILNKPSLATVATSGNYNDLLNKPTIPAIPANVSAFNNDVGYITLSQVPSQVNADWNAATGAAQILNKPNFATVATSGNYNDLSNKPVIPTVPSNVSTFTNDAGYITSEQVPAQVNADWNATDGVTQILNKPTLFSGNYNDLTNKPTNADFGQGIVRTNVNNASGATDISVTFTGYVLVNGGVVSLSFARNVPAGATLNINNKGAKPILWKGVALTDGVIKAGDRCLFMYNSGGNSYYLLANDRWGVDIDALATVAHTGSYNDLTDKPELFSGDYNALTNKPTIPTVPTNVSAFVNDAGYLTAIPDSVGGFGVETDPVFSAWNKDYNDLTNKPNLASVATSGSYNDLTNKPTNATFGQGIVRQNVSNAVGTTDINVTFTGYVIENGGVVSLAFANNVPAGATLNINNQGAKIIRWKGVALTAGVIKAGDRCLFMYNAGANSYYLLANDRWGDNAEDLAAVAYTGSYNDLSNTPEFASVATSGNYNDLTNKPTIPTVPTNVSAFVNDAGYLTAIPDSFGGLSIESDPIFSAWDRDYNDLTNKPTLFSGNYNDLTNKPTNADFGQGIVRTNVNNASGATDISVTFTGYVLVNGGVVSLSFARNVPAGATLNINNKGAKPILWKGVALTDGVIKAGDRCLFMYNSGGNSYYLLANDRWGVDVDALATVARTGSYNDLTDKPELFSGDYNALTNKPVIPTIPTNVSAFVNDAGYLTALPDSFGGLGIESDPVFSAWNKDYNDLTNRPNLASVATSGNYNDLTNKPTNATFGQGIVRQNVSNAVGTTDIKVTFTGYMLENGGVVSLAFANNVPAGATLNINNQGAKMIRWKGVALTAGVIKAGDRCLFMYNAGANSYYLLANDRWGDNAEDLAAVAYTGSYNDLANTPEFAPVATSGNYNDLTNKPTIPTVPTHLSAFINDMGYLTAIPDSFGGVSLESDPIFSAWDRDYNDLTNKPILFSGNYNDLTNKPTNADFGQGIVRTNVNNASGATDISVTFTGYVLVNGGVVSLSFARNVPAGATLNINNKGAKPILWKGVALTDGVIKAGDRCLFMYNSGGNSYYLLANDRWGVDVDALATVARTGSYNDLVDKPDLASVATSGNYNDLVDKPTLAPVATTGNYNDLTDKPDLFSGNYNDLTGKPNLFSGDYNDLNNKPTNTTFGQGLVRTKVSNAVGATNISVTFTGYTLETGGIVSLAFVNNVPAGATLNINNKGAKPIYYKEVALTAGTIKAGDRCLFMYNSGAGRYYLLANDRWGDNVDALATVAHTGSYEDLIDKPNLAPVATGGSYNDLTDKPNLAPVATSGDYNDLSGKPVNADFGHGIVRTNVNNPSGATDISVTFTGYVLTNGGIVSLSFARNVPAGATLNINNQGAKMIRWKGVALTAGVIKAGDRCLFMYNASASSYYLLANDRWGEAPSSLATVATSGNYNDLANKPNIPTKVSAFDNDAGYITSEQINGVDISALANMVTALQQQVAMMQATIDSLREAPDGSPCSGIPSVTDYDGNIYSTVKIGNQCWMRQNLRTTHFADGTAISVGGNATSNTVPYYYDYSGSDIPLMERGYLYNWLATMHGSNSSSANPSGVQGICPTGWHVPSDAEWTQLTDYVSAQSKYQCGGSNNIAKALATATRWNTSNGDCIPGGQNVTANNATGFGALPTGFYDGGYQHSGISLDFWSATESFNGNAWGRYLGNDNPGMGRDRYSKSFGFSVRCLRD